MINFLDKNEREEALKLLGYPEDSVGRLMTPDYVAVRPEWSIQKAFDHIRKYGREAETINMIYVVDKSWKQLNFIAMLKYRKKVHLYH